MKRTLLKFLTLQGYYTSAQLTGKSVSEKWKGEGKNGEGHMIKSIRVPYKQLGNVAAEEEKITKVPSLSDRKDVSAFRKGRRYKRNHEFVGKDYEFNFGYTSLKANMSLNLKIGTSLKMLYQDCFSAAINFLKGL